MTSKISTRILPVLGLVLGACQSTTESSVPAFNGSTTATRTNNTGATNVTTPSTVGRQAPDFTLTDANGNRVSLGDFRGQVVVLEWFNPKCEFVSFVHQNGSLSQVVEEFGGQGVQFLAINSTAPGNIGFSSAYGQAMCNQWGFDVPLLADETGRVQSAFGVQNTPTVVVIDEQGTVRYQGSPDNNPLGNTRGKNGVVNHLRNALESVLAGREVSRSSSKEYGCPIERTNRATN